MRIVEESATRVVIANRPWIFCAAMLAGCVLFVGAVARNLWVDRAITQDVWGPAIGAVIMAAMLFYAIDFTRFEFSRPDRRLNWKSFSGRGCQSGTVGFDQIENVVLDSLFGGCVFESRSATAVPGGGGDHR